jgi:predicted TIM-barrel fold metal-dependent hydrolase
MVSRPARTLIDCHVHLAAFSEGSNGCYISPRMLQSPVFKFLLWKHGLNASAPDAANQKYVDNLLEELRASQYVGQAVLLGMDGVYDREGRIDQQATEFVVSNDYVLNTTKTYPNEFLAGVSINPQRRDALDELHRCAEAGATLVKILPNTQQFDPAHQEYKPFYRTLAKLRIPLLSHVGYEFSLISRDQTLGDPNRLRVALDEGATVIAAHACSYGLMLYEKFLPTFLDLVSRYQNFYADISALTQPNRFKMLLLLRQHPEVHNRLLFGTDYPLPVFHLPTWGRVGMTSLKKIMRTTNRFDRQFQICRTLGLNFGSLQDVFPEMFSKHR